MNNKRRCLLPALLLVIALGLLPVRAQTTAHAVNTTVPAASTLQLLPASDVVLLLDHRRILDEAIPRLFGNNTAPLAKIFAAGDEFKAKTGIDPRSIDSVALGVRLINVANIVKGPDKKDLGIVIIAQGDFDANKFIAFMRSEGKDRVREETYKGQTIYTMDEREKGSTKPLPPDIEIPALAVLDANTIAIGDLMQVRATVDAKSGSGGLSPELLSLATRNSNALISLAGNIPEALAVNFAPKGSSGDGELDQTVTKFFETIASIQQMYISLGLSPTNGIETWIDARLSSTEKAQSLGDMLLGVQQKYSVFIDDKVIRDLVTSMKIKAAGDEVQLRAELPQAALAMLLKPPSAPVAKPTEKATAKPTAATTTTHTRKKTRRSTRRKKG